MAAASKKPKKILNISVAFNHAGKHYPGMAIFDGVGFGLVDAPCGAGRQLISLSGAGEADVKWPSGVFWDTASCSNDKSEVAVTGYLKIKPV